MAEWQGYVLATINNAEKQASLWYDEESKKGVVGEWEDLRKSTITEKKFIDDKSPVWSFDGKDIWWNTNAAWERLPEWISEPPISLCVFNSESTSSEIYRPLSERDCLVFSYYLPSPSFDGKWIACKLGNRKIVIIGVNNQSFYCLNQECLLFDRVSWKDDSSAFIFIQPNNEYAVIQPVGSLLDIPFSQPSQRLDLPSKCQFIEFLPKTSNQFIAVFDKNQLVKITLDETNKPAIEKIYESINPIKRMHVSPDGKYVMISSDNEIIKIAIDDKSFLKIEWIKQIKLSGIDQSNYINNMDWSISPDGKKIAFSAYSKTKNAEVICSANIDGSELKLISPDDPSAKRKRHMLNKKSPVVFIDNLSVGTLKKIGYLDDFYWPVPAVSRTLLWERTKR